ncbi:Glycosyl transferase family 2 [Pustulibacterium marinum]|uniref:Glycosyl transferase family 2 n=1 Tax=Pustulibacterium marinum TaxID=1224947 RepID=A0A1I7HN67_9FLAO|nr:Glycosyl transferase family 2 [Pustulibacterium marinum]
MYNREQIILDTLQSISAQTYSNWECIIVDDGSTDKTLEVLLQYQQKDARFRILKRPSVYTKGANACRNYGFEVAKGNFVNWFDSDDIMEPTFLEEKVNQFTSPVNAVVHRNRYSNYELTKFRESKFNFSGDLFYNYALESIEIQTCGFMWRKSYLKDFKLFDENIQRYQDNEFHIRMLAESSLNLIVLDKVLATVRSGDGHKSQISAKVNLSKDKLFDVFYYRYQCLFLAISKRMKLDDNFFRTISKKALWSFYAALQFEKDLKQRKVDFNRFKETISFVFKHGKLSLIDVIKSKVYIFKILFIK